MKDYFYFAIAIHGILMFMAWGILLPIGAYIARYCRQYFGIKWFVYHRNIMISAAICTLTGATLGIIACESHFNKIHKVKYHQIDHYPSNCNLNLLIFSRYLDQF